VKRSDIVANGGSWINDNITLREPDCSAIDCYYNSKNKCGARPYISVNSEGKCLDYDKKED